MTETKKKHTPGSWHAAHVGDCGRDNDIPVYDICDEHNWRFAEVQREANARLIAAAPELLAALKQVIVDWDNFSGNRNDMSRYVSIMADTIKDVQAAISKAEGHNG